MGVKTMCDIPDNVLEQLQADMAEIKVALLGNQYNPQGALYKIAQHEKSIEYIEKRISKAIWTAAGAGTAAGFIISILFKLLPFLTS